MQNYTKFKLVHHFVFCFLFCFKITASRRVFTKRILVTDVLFFVKNVDVHRKNVVTKWYIDFDLNFLIMNTYLLRKYLKNELSHTCICIDQWLLRHSQSHSVFYESLNILLCTFLKWYNSIAYIFVLWIIIWFTNIAIKIQYIIYNHQEKYQKFKISSILIFREYK